MPSDRPDCPEPPGQRRESGDRAPAVSSAMPGPAARQRGAASQRTRSMRRHQGRGSGSACGLQAADRKTASSARLATEARHRVRRPGMTRAVPCIRLARSGRVRPQRLRRHPCGQSAKRNALRPAPGCADGTAPSSAVACPAISWASSTTTGPLAKMFGYIVRRTDPLAAISIRAPVQRRPDMGQMGFARSLRARPASVCRRGQSCQLSIMPTAAALPGETKKSSRPSACSRTGRSKRQLTVPSGPVSCRPGPL